MTVAESIDVRQALRGDSFGVEEIAQIEKAIASPQVSEVRREVNALEAEVDAAGNPSDTQLLRIGITAYLLGLHQRAESYLSQAPGDPLGQFYLGQVLLSLGRNDDAGKAFEQASKVGYDAVECSLRRVEALRNMGQLDAAEELLRGVSKDAAGRAE